MFVNKDEQAGYDARHLPASQHRAGPDPTQAVGHGPSAVWTALVYALKPHSLPAPWRDGSGAAATGPRSVLCFVSKGRAAQDMTLPSPQAETEPGGFFLTGSTVAVGQCGVTLGWELILFPHENATGRPRKASSEHRAGTDAVMLSSSAARGHRSPSRRCWAGRYRSAVKHHDHKSQTNPPLHDAGSDGLTQSTEGSLLFYRWDISHNAAALRVRAGGTSAFHRANCRSCSQRREVRSRRRVAEQQRGCYRTCRRSCVRRGSCTTVTAPSVGVCRNPAFAHFRQTQP